MKRVLIRVFLFVRHCWRRAVYGIRFFGKPISVDPSSWVSRHAIVRVQGGGRVSIGSNCEIHPFSILMTYGGDIEMGDHCSLNPFSVIYGHGGVRLGNGVRVATHSVIVPGNHNPTENGEPVYLSGTTKLGINIGDHVWLGAGVRVLDGVEIGRNAAVGAGSVVTKSVPENATVAGVPAKLLRQR